MVTQAHVGHPNHSTLQRHGFTSLQATTLMDAGIDNGKLLAWIESERDTAIRLLKTLIPKLPEDPQMAGLLGRIIDKMLAA
jgi:hypothetical protein